MDNVEKSIWDYIDGQCTAGEREQIAEKIKTDGAWAKTYARLCQLHQSIGKEIPVEQPSMRFAANIMDEIDSMSLPGPVSSYINSTLIKVIAALMSLCMASLLGFAFARVGQKPAGPADTDSQLEEFIYQAIDYVVKVQTGLGNASLFLLMATGVLLLAIVDRWLALKRKEV